MRGGAAAAPPRRALRSGERRAVEVDQARDAALAAGSSTLVVVDQDVHLVEQEGARHLVGGDLVGLLHQRLALLRIGLQALLVDQLVDPGIGEDAERHLVLVAQAAVELGAGLHPVDQAVVGVVVAARAEPHQVEVHLVERVDQHREVACVSGSSVMPRLVLRMLAMTWTSRRWSGVWMILSGGMPSPSG